MTDLELRAGQIHRGLGVVARWPDIAIVIPSDGAHDAIVDQMFHDVGPSPTAPQLVAAINELLAEGRLQSVAMLVEANGGPLAMAYGPVEVLVDGDQLLTGTNGGVRRQLSTDAHRLTIRATNLTKAAEPVAPYDLRRGIAPGAGLTLVTIAASAPPAPVANGHAPSQVPTPSPAPAAAMAAAPVDTAAAAHAEHVGHEPAVAPTDEPAAVPASWAPPEAQVAETRADGAETPAAPVGVEVDARVDIGGEAGVDAAAVDSDIDASAEAPSTEAAPDGGRFDGFDDGAGRQGPAIDPAALNVPHRSVALQGAVRPGGFEPLPLADLPRAGALSRDELDAGRVEVEGILCQRQHFNDPSASNCMVCGLSMLHLTPNLVLGPRPTLGFVVFDDGSTFGLDRSYVIGREPMPADDQAAELLVLNDNNETLSRTHAELRLSAWSVQLVDLNSTNGTYIWDPASERWNQLTPGQPVELSSSDTVALGRRTFVFESVSRG